MGSAFAAAGMLKATELAGQEQKSYPTKNERSASAPGPGNQQIDQQNPASFLPPSSDAGGVQTFKYPFGISHKRMQQGGWSREVTVRDRPVSKTIAGVDMRLTAGGVRELHWHTAAEWAIMLYGNARITGLDVEGKGFVTDVGEGDLWYFPTGILHSIQGLNPDGCEFLLVFDDGNFSEYETVLLTDWMAHTPHDVLAANFGVSQQAAWKINFSRRTIFSIACLLVVGQGSRDADEGCQAHSWRRSDNSRFERVRSFHHDRRRDCYRCPGRNSRTALASERRRVAVLHQRCRKNDGVRYRRLGPHHGLLSWRRRPCPKTLPHYVQNTGSTELKFLENV